MREEVQVYARDNLPLGRAGQAQRPAIRRP